MKQCLRITELMPLTSGDRGQSLGGTLGWFGGLYCIWDLPGQKSSLLVRAIFPQPVE